jgi:hypothetical protein
LKEQDIINYLVLQLYSFSFILDTVCSLIQIFSLSMKHELRRDYKCAEWTGSAILLRRCDGKHGQQHWRHQQVRGRGRSERGRGEMEREKGEAERGDSERKRGGVERQKRVSGHDNYAKRRREKGIRRTREGREILMKIDRERAADNR